MISLRLASDGRNPSMPSTRATRRAFAIARNQRQERRAIFMTELHNSLPRVPLGASTTWQANARSIGFSIDADRLLRENGFDRWGNPRG